MNYLAHLHIAERTNTSFSGNFLGDFVKGDPVGKFPKEMVTGIRLHRYVDSYIDKHEAVLEAKHCFPEPLRRFAPIALDMFWDHCLSFHWNKFHHLPLTQFCQHAEQMIEQERVLGKVAFPERFTRINGWVWQDKWLESYQKLANIEYALQRIATRSERMAPLAETGKVLAEHYERLTETFFVVYRDVLAVSDIFVADTKKEA